MLKYKEVEEKTKNGYFDIMNNKEIIDSEFEEINFEDNDELVYINMYAKIFTDSFPPIAFFVNDEDLFNCLLAPTIVGCEDGDCEKEIIAPAIWLLGTNEKVGFIIIMTRDNKKFERRWSVGESSWQNVIDMMEFIRNNELLTIDQLKTVYDILQEGIENFDSMYDIFDFIKAKENNLDWKHPHSGEEMRDQIKKNFEVIKQYFESKGYTIL